MLEISYTFYDLRLMNSPYTVIKVRIQLQMFCNLPAKPARETIKFFTILLAVDWLVRILVQVLMSVENARLRFFSAFCNVYDL